MNERTSSALLAVKPPKTPPVQRMPAMTDAAKLVGVTNHAIRRAIKDGILPAEQVVPDAPYQIRASDLQDQKIIAAITRKGRPCRSKIENQIQMFSDT